jgi:hypothetical protein
MVVEANPTNSFGFVPSPMQLTVDGSKFQSPTVSNIKQTNNFTGHFLH